jgi:hypothetical protein
MLKAVGLPSLPQLPEARLVNLATIIRQLIVLTPPEREYLFRWLDRFGADLPTVNDWRGVPRASITALVGTLDHLFERVVPALNSRVQAALGELRRLMEQRKSPKHKRWKKWRDQELSYGAIRNKHEAGTGEKLTRDAIIKGIKRLEELEERLEQLVRVINNIGRLDSKDI